MNKSSTVTVRQGSAQGASSFTGPLLIQADTAVVDTTERVELVDGDAEL